MSAPVIETTMSGSTPEQSQSIVAFLRRDLNQIPDIPSTRWRRRLTEAQIFEVEGNVPAAISSYRESATLIEEERDTMPSDVASAGFIKDKVHVFDRLTLALLSQAEYAEAFGWNEKARAWTMSETLLSAWEHLPTEAERHLYLELKAVREANEAAFAEGATATSAAAAAKYEALLGRIRQLAPRLFDLLAAPQASLDQLRNMMGAERFDLVYYFLDSGRLIIWRIGPERIDVQSHYVFTSVLPSTVIRLHESLSSKGPFDEEASCDLYFGLVEPMLARLETKQLVIVVPPEFENLPFAALMNPKSGHFLGETLTVSYAPSAAVLMRMQLGRKLERANVLAFTAPGLVHGEKDAAAIAKMFPKHTVVLPDSATSSTLMKEARGRSVVHLAAHGEYMENDPMLSHIKIQPEPGHDGRLSATDMLALPLEGVLLVMVASCTAARVSSDSGREIYGITRSLIYAGAQNVLLPLWEVDDEAASLWVTSFYRAAREVPLAEAVRRANMELRRHPIYGAHPRFWAAFKLVGH